MPKYKNLRFEYNKKEPVIRIDVPGLKKKEIRADFTYDGLSIKRVKRGITTEREKVDRQELFGESFKEVALPHEMKKGDFDITITDGAITLKKKASSPIEPKPIEYKKQPQPQSKEASYDESIAIRIDRGRQIEREKILRENMDKGTFRHMTLPYEMEKESLDNLKKKAEATPEPKPPEYDAPKQK